MASGVQIFEAYYVKTSVIASALAKTINEGDIITDADLQTAAVTWKQIQVSSDLSGVTLGTDPLTKVQNGSTYKDDSSRQGFFATEGTLEVEHYNGISTTHSEIFENGLGTKEAHSIVAGTLTADANHTDSITVDATGIVVGDYIEVNGYIARVLTVTGGTGAITLNVNVNGRSGDAVIGRDSWNLQTLTNNDSFILFLETAKGSYFVPHCRFGVDVDIQSGDFLKLMINFQGDKRRISALTKSTLGTITKESINHNSSTGNFTGVYIDTDSDKAKYCTHTFNPKITREMNRLKCEGTESRQGNGGTFRDKFTTELTFVAYIDKLKDEYEANEQIAIFASRPGFAIDAKKCLIKSDNLTNVVDDLLTTTYEISMNTDMDEDFKVVI